MKNLFHIISGFCLVTGSLITLSACTETAGGPAQLDINGDWLGVWSADESPNDVFLIIDGFDVLRLERQVLPDASECFQQTTITDLIIDDSVFHQRVVIEYSDQELRNDLFNITGVVLPAEDFPIERTSIIQIRAGESATNLTLATTAYLVFDEYYPQNASELSEGFTASNLQEADLRPLCL